MITVLTDEEVAERRKSNFRFVEPGFIVDVMNIRVPVEARYVLVKEKDEITETLKVVPLTQENIFLLLGGTVPLTTTIGKSDLLNVHATAITDSMCREREGFYTHCASCKEVVYRWQGLRQGTQNYYVGLDGLCRHIDCSDNQKSKHSR